MLLDAFVSEKKSHTDLEKKIKTFQDTELHIGF